MGDPAVVESARRALSEMFASELSEPEFGTKDFAFDAALDAYAERIREEERDRCAEACADRARQTRELMADARIGLAVREPQGIRAETWEAAASAIRGTPRDE